MERIPFKNVHNFRSLGNKPLTLYKCTNSNVFYRSDLIHRLNEEEISYLINHQIQHIIDLRSSEEVRRRPNQLVGDERFNYYHLPLVPESGENKMDLQGHEDFEQFYISLIKYGSNYKEIFNILANSNEAVVYHCTAGKDRTGIITALLLSLVNVSRLDILADYKISDTLIEKARQDMIEQYPDMPIHIMLSLEKWLQGMLEYIEINYGTVNEFLLTKGVDPLDINKIIDKLSR